MTLRRKISIGLLLVLAGLAAWPVVAHYRVAGRLAAYKKELKARGEKITIKEQEAAPPRAAVAALLRLTDAANRLGNAPTNMPPAMRYLTNGHAVAAWQQSILPTEETADLWPALAIEMGAKSNLIAELQAALQSTQIVAALDFSQGVNVQLNHLSALKCTAQWLQSAALRDLHDGNPAEAFQSVRALTALGSAYQGEPLLISTLVRIAIRAIGMAVCWAALQAPDWTDAQWSEIQSLWEQSTVLEQAEPALAMERALGADLFEKGRNSYAAISQAGFGSGGTAMADLADVGKKALEDPGQALQDFRHRFSGYWRWKLWDSYEDELVIAKAIQAGLEAVRKVRRDSNFTTAFAGMESEIARLLAQHPEAGKWLDDSWIRGRMLSSFTRRLVDSEVHRKLLITAIGLKRYEMRHGTCPRELAQLSPEFLSSVTLDLDAKPLRYSRVTEREWKLYSIGSDGIDNGGLTLAVLDPNTGNPARVWWRFKDAVWPNPAKPDQVQSYLEGINTERRKQAEARESRSVTIPPTPP